MKEKGLPQEILDRHYKFIRHYEENLNELKANFDAIESAFTESEINTQIKKLKAFLEKVKPPKRHIPLDPNKLPHRTAEPVWIEPRLNYSDGLGVMSDEKKTNSQPILVASNGSLTGLLDNSPSVSDLPIHPFTDSPMLLALADPSLRSGQALPTPADLAETIKVQFTPEIKAKAEELGNNPVKIYEYVRNNFEYEPYYGSLKGAQQTLLERAGNDFNQASLLIALLRASNIPARYVYGTVEIPIEDIKSWLGIDDTNMALTALASSGTPLSAITSGGTIIAARLEHVWCQAFVPYVQSRGALEGQGDTWIDLDPSFKTIFKEIAESISLPIFDQSQYLLSLKQNDPVNEYESNI